MSAANVFGVIVAGRLLQTEFLQTNETEFVTEVANADAINHVVVFLTGVQPFPDNYGGSVYIRWKQQTNSGGDTNWHYLGFISNSKPSAIFKVGQLHKTEASANHSSLFDISHNQNFGNISDNGAQIGVLVETLNTIEARVPVEGSAPSQQATIVEFTEKMLRNFVNHLNSFAIALPNPNNFNRTTEFVPYNVVQEWFNTFQRRLQLNPNFWKTLP